MRGNSQLLEGVECQAGTSVKGRREDVLPLVVEIWLFDVSLAAGNELQLPVLFRTEASSFIRAVLEWSEGSSSAKADPALPVWLWVQVQRSWGFGCSPLAGGWFSTGIPCE